MNRARKALSGMILALLLLGLGELGARALLGPPPPSQQLVRVSVARLEVAGPTATLRHAVDPRQDVQVPVARGERPRVVFLGGSSVRHAWVSPPEVNFPTHVARLLPAVEVVNLGSPGQTLGGLVGVARALAPLQPDLVVVYAGHNDFAQSIMLGRVRSPSLRTLPLLRLASQSWLFAGLRGLKGHLGAAGGVNMQGRGQRLLPTADRWALDTREALLADLQRDLRALVRASPAPTLLLTQLASFHHAPTGVLAAPGTACAEQSARWPVVRGQGAPPPAALALEAAAACGPDAAYTLWAQAHAVQAQDPAQAAALYLRSRDLDPLPIRAPAQANEVTRAVAQAEGAALLDLERTLGPITPAGWFDDLLHPSQEGAARIAAAVAPAVQEQLKGR